MGPAADAPDTRGKAPPGQTFAPGIVGPDGRAVPGGEDATADWPVADLALDFSSLPPPTGRQDLSVASAPLEQSIPGYEILSEIHRGGQGVVYQAIQKATRRRVAIKVMRQGPFAGARDKARFDREVQILATLNHPNIVAIHDSGIAAGSFYFVMDYISGQPLDEYMAAATRSIPEILRLFLKICNAVNAAHLRGVIHRDLKPSNIRIDTDGQPHILDFGLAKMVMGTVTDESRPEMMTVTGQFVGSLPWASPEQAEGLPGKIDVRTDVYSLGVVLYQMLTGRFPYNVAGHMRDVLEEIIHTEPASPSTHRRDVNDEIATIVLKCLAKERDRRYQSAGELGRDVARYLAGEPIEAKRDSLGYLVRKQLRRYRIPVAIAAAFVVLVGIGLIASLTFWRQAVYQRDAAERESLRAQAAEQEAMRQKQFAEARLADVQVAETRAVREARRAVITRDLLQQMLASARPTREGDGRNVKVADLLDGMSADLTQKLPGQPEIEIDLRRTLGETYIALGLYGGAIANLDRARKLAAATLDPSHPDTIQVSGRLAWALQEAHRFPEAEALARECLTKARETLGREHDTTCEIANTLAVTLNYQRKLDEAETIYRELLKVARHRSWRPDSHNSVPALLHNLAWVLRQKGDLTGAEILQREALSELDQAPAGGSEKPRHRYYTNLAGILERQGRLSEAVEIYEATLVAYRRTLGEDHPDTRRLIQDYARVVERLGRFDEAIALRREILSWLQKQNPDDDDAVAAAMVDWGYLLGRAGEIEEAARAIEQAIANRRRLHGDDDEQAQQWWRHLVIQRGLGPPAAWKSPALRRHAFDLLERILASQPTRTFSLDECRGDTMAFRIAPWEGRPEAPATRRTLAEMQSLDSPAPGLYVMAIEMERAGFGLLRDAAWMLVAAWRVDFYTFETPVIDMAAWQRLIEGEPCERRLQPTLNLANDWSACFGPAGRYDHFGIVARGTVRLPAGSYRFLATSDDGLRLAVDGHPLIDSWTPRSATLDTARLDLTGERHELRVDYFQAGGPARLTVQVEPLGAEAVTLLSLLLDEDPGAVSRRALEEGNVLEKEERLAEAEISYRRALDILETLPRVGEQKQTPVLAALARVLSQQGKHVPAIEFYRRSLAIQKRLQGPDDAATLRTMRDLARELAAVGGDETAEAIELCRTAADAWTRIRGQTDEESLQAMMDLLLVCHQTGREEEASAVQSRLLELARAVAARGGERSPHITYRIAQIMERQPDPAPIEEAFRIAYEAVRAAWGEDSFEATHRLHGMAAVQHRQGKLEEAESAYRLSLQIRSRVLGSRNPEVTWALRDLTNVLVDEGRLREAEDLCRELVDIRREVWGSDNDETIDGTLQLASILTAAGEKEEAERCLRKAVECLTRTKGQLHARTCDARRQLGSYLLGEGRLEEAETELLAAQKGLRLAGGRLEASYRLAMQDLLRLYDRWGKPQLAAEWRDRLNALDLSGSISSVTYATRTTR